MIDWEGFLVRRQNAMYVRQTSRNQHRDAVEFPLRAAEQRRRAGGSRRGLSESSRCWVMRGRVPQPPGVASSAGRGRRTGGGGCDSLAAGPLAGAAASAPANTTGRSRWRPYPHRASRDRVRGAPFLWLLSFGEAKESDQPPGCPRRR